MSGCGIFVKVKCEMDFCLFVCMLDVWYFCICDGGEGGCGWVILWLLFGGYKYMSLVCKVGC